MAAHAAATYRQQHRGEVRVAPRAYYDAPSLHADLLAHYFAIIACFPRSRGDEFTHAHGLLEAASMMRRHQRPAEGTILT